MNEQIMIWSTGSSLAAILAAITAIHLVLTRKKEYEDIVENYKEQIDEVEQRTTEAIKRLYANSANVVENEVAEIKNRFDETLQSQKNINKSLKDYEEVIIRIYNHQIELNNKIKEKDMIIERKTKQIAKLKKRLIDES